MVIIFWIASCARKDEDDGKRNWIASQARKDDGQRWRTKTNDITGLLRALAKMMSKDDENSFRRLCEA